jgi:hypothetical protein
VKASEHESFPHWSSHGQRTTTGLQRMRFKSKYMMLDSSTGPLYDPLVFLQNFLPPARNIYFPGFDQDKVFRVAFTPVDR